MAKPTPIRQPTRQSPKPGCAGWDTGAERPQSGPGHRRFPTSHAVKPSAFKAERTTIYAKGASWMPNITITDVGDAREWASKQGGSFVSYMVEFDGEAKGYAELTKKPESPAPAVGEQMEVEIIPGRVKDEATGERWPSRIKRLSAAPQSPSNGPAQPLVSKPTPMDLFVDARQRAILRQHSQTAAIYWAAVLQKAGEVPEGPKVEWLRGIIDWFDDDVKQAVKPL